MFKSLSYVQVGDFCTRIWSPVTWLSGYSSLNYEIRQSDYVDVSLQTDVILSILLKDSQLSVRNNAHLRKIEVGDSRTLTFRYP